MHIRKIRFDRVFDVQEGSGDFSFEDGGRPVYGVNAAGMGIPRQGATHAVAFAEPGNWNTVIAWRDLATSQVALKRSAWAFAVQQLPYHYLMIVVCYGMVVALGGYRAALPVGALALLVVGAGIYRAAWRNRQAVRALRAVHPAVPAPEGKRKPSRLARAVWALAPLLWK